MSPAEKKKLYVAIGALSLAAIIVVWRLAFGGPGATREERAAQEAVLEQMGSNPEPPPGESAGGTPGPSSESPPAGRAREFKRGT